MKAFLAAALFAAVAASVAAAASGAPRSALPPAPTVTIVAQFVQADFATYYQAEAAPAPGPGTDVAWHFQPPANDPGCNKFSSDDLFVDRASWLHGDQDGCDHAKEGPQGHQGTITLQYEDDNWSCTAFYAVTNDGTSQPATCQTQAKIDAQLAFKLAIQSEETALQNLNHWKRAGVAVRNSLTFIAHAKAALGKLSLRPAVDVARDLDFVKRLDEAAESDIKLEHLHAVVDLRIALRHKQSDLAQVAKLP